MDKESKYRINSIQRACQILKCFSLSRPELSLVEISNLTQIPKPTVFRILSTLEESRFIQRTTDPNKYQIGILGFELGSVYLGHLSVERIAHPIMDELAVDYGMSTNLGMLDDGKVVYLATSDPRDVMRYNPIIGYRHFIHCSALGKMLVADQTSDNISAMLEKHGMPALSEFSITEKEVFLNQVETVRLKQHAIDDQESAVGMFCLAVPIRNHEGNVRFAMSISGPKLRFSGDQFDHVLSKMKEGASKISEQLGWKSLP
ncbi:MAG: IclR family transcriptional regulator [Anaerolineaceae bacterium]|nr:IclR family transcriptional regulator [Anaerolineaceae bacterium]